MKPESYWNKKNTLFVHGRTEVATMLQRTIYVFIYIVNNTWPSHESGAEIFASVHESGTGLAHTLIHTHTDIQTHITIIPSVCHNYLGIAPEMKHIIRNGINWHYTHTQTMYARCTHTHKYCPYSSLRKA